MHTNYLQHEYQNFKRIQIKKPNINVTFIFSYSVLATSESPPPKKTKTSQIINHENFLRLKRRDLFTKVEYIYHMNGQ